MKFFESIYKEDFAGLLSIRSGVTVFDRRRIPLSGDAPEAIGFNLIKFEDQCVITTEPLFSLDAAI